MDEKNPGPFRVPGWMAPVEERRAYDMTAEEVRLMHYRAAALTGLVARGNSELCVGSVERIAQAMLAAERKAGT